MERWIIEIQTPLLTLLKKYPPEGLIQYKYQHIVFNIFSNAIYSNP